MFTPRQITTFNPGIFESRPGSGAQGNFTAVGNLLFFVADDGVSGRELWRSDGTSSGTIRLSDIWQGTGSSNPYSFAALDSTIYFVARDASQNGNLWRSDGTVAGTVQITDFSSSVYSANSVVILDRSIYFLASSSIGGRLWRSDGTSMGSVPVSNILFGASWFTAVGNVLYFPARDSPYGPNVNVELWKSDGTESGTFQVADIYPGNRTEESSEPRRLTAVGETLFFTAEDGVSGFELWKSDGTPTGTTRIADINPGNSSSLNGLAGGYYSFPTIGRTIFFSASDGVSGYELWKSDGTQLGTLRVADINLGPGSSSPSNLTVVGDSVFFTAFDTPGLGPSMWKSDGSSAGTVLVSRVGTNIAAYNGSDPRYLTAAGNSLFFTAVGNGTTGRELWKTDGTSAGTVLVADILPGVEGSDPRDLKVVGNRLFFSAKSPSGNGRQLWALDLEGPPLTVVRPPSPSSSTINHAFLEVLAKDLVYQNWNVTPQNWESQILNSPYNPNRLNYRLSRSFGSESLGFFGIGLIADDAPPILVLRGTGDLLDVLSDANPLGVGFDQFLSIREEINDWLGTVDAVFDPYITGHSLGGSLSQWFAADYTASQPGRLSEVVTFNSTGIEKAVRLLGSINTYGSSTFSSDKTGAVTHYVTSADLVSLAGDDFIPGDFYISDYVSNINVLGVHLNPVLAKRLPVSGLSNPTVEKPKLRSFDDLISPSFGYSNDSDHWQFRLTVASLGFAAVKAAGLLGPGAPVAAFVGKAIINFAASIGTRSGLETWRRNLLSGSSLGITSDTFVSLFKEALSYAKQDEAYRSEAVQAAIHAVQTGGPAALEALQSWGDGAWAAVGSWRKQAWQQASNWTASTWDATTNYTDEIWDRLTNRLQSLALDAVIFVGRNTINFFLQDTTPQLQQFRVMGMEATIPTGTDESDNSIMSFGAAASPSTRTISVPISLSQARKRSIQLRYETVDGSALSGQDYVASSGVLNFAPGEVEKFISIDLLPGDQPQQRKTLAIRLFDPQNVELLLDDRITITVIPNTTPSVGSPIPDQQATIAQPFFFAVPQGTFVDPDISNSDFLTLSATLADGSPLPGWLVFDHQRLSFSGTPDPTDLGRLTIRVTAEDLAGSSTSTTFSLLTGLDSQIVQSTGDAVASQFIGDGVGRTFRGSTAGDIYDITAGGANVILGTPDQLSNDRVLGFDQNDIILLKNVEILPGNFSATLLGNSVRLTFQLPPTNTESGSQNGSSIDILLQGPYDPSTFGFSGVNGSTKIVYAAEEPVVTLALSTSSAPEDTGDGLKFTFSRTGLATSALDVNYTVSGTASLGSDYTGIPLAGNFKTVTFAAGSATATFTIEPTADALIEADETIQISLSGGTGYTVGTPRAVVGSIIDSDFTPGARTINGVNLGSTQLGFAIRQGSGAPIQVSISGQLASASNPGAGWTPLAAAATAGGYDLYWRNSVSGQYARWNLNSTGAFIGGEALTPNQFLQAETSLNADLDGDGSSGLLYTAGARTINGVNLGSTQLGFAIRPGAGAPIQVSISGQLASASNPGAGWSPLAAAATAGGYDLYWRNSVSGQLARWNLNSSGAFVAGGVLTLSQFLQAETSLNVDLDSDGSTGLVYTAGARTINGVNLGSTQLGFAIRAGSAAPVQVSIFGQLATATNPGAGWTPLAAAATAGGYDLYWRNSVSGQLARWNLNSSGSFIGGEALTPNQFLQAETSLNADLDGDGSTGLLYTAGARTINGVNLGSTQLGFAIRQGSGAPIQVSISGQLASASNPGAGWTPLAAAATAGGYDLYWRNSVSGQYARWNLNSSGAFIGGEALTPNQFLQAETSLNADLDGDGSTGLLYTAGARTINGVNLGSTQLGFAIRPGAGAPIQVSISGQLASASNPGAGWSPLAAAATAGGYDLYWRNSVSGQLARWNLNSSGAFIGGEALTPNQFLQAETSLNADLDGDGSTGLLYTAGARTINGVNLGSTQLGFAIRPGAGAPIQVSISGQLASATNPGAGWSPLAAAASTGGYDLYWRNTVSGQLARWNLNSTGEFVGGGVLNIHQFLAEESRLNQDLDGDTLTGISRTSQIATVSLFSTTGGYALDTNSLDPLLLVPITAQGSQISATNPGAGWTAIAAAADATGGFDLYWKNNNNGAYARWDLNTSAGFVGGSVLTLSQLFGEESRLAFDLNRDGVVGGVI